MLQGRQQQQQQVETRTVLSWMMVVVTMTAALWCSAMSHWRWWGSSCSTWTPSLWQQQHACAGRVGGAEGEKGPTLAG